MKAKNRETKNTSEILLNILNYNCRTDLTFVLKEREGKKKKRKRVELSRLFIRVETDVIQNF